MIHLSPKKRKVLAESVMQFEQENKVAKLISSTTYIPNKPTKKTKVSKRRF